MANFLIALLQALGLLGLSTAIGGLLFAPLVLRPAGAGAALYPAARRRTLRLVALGSATLLAALAAALTLRVWELAGEFGFWPWREFMATSYGTAALARLGLAALLALLALRLAAGGGRGAWVAAGVVAALLVATGAWLAHAVSRLEHTERLMALTVAHQLGAAIWVGGIVHLVALWRLARGTPADPTWPRALARFSPVGLVAVTLLTLGAFFVALHYVGDGRSLIGTSYGIMALTKTALLACALTLAALNFRLSRGPAPAAQGGCPTRALVPGLVEAELAIVAVTLLAAVSLTTLPPAVDSAEERASPAEVLALFVPETPVLLPPSRAELEANYVSPLDRFTPSSETDKLQSTFNHNVAGLLVLLVALAAIADRSLKVPLARHWPLLFLPLAVFLLIYAQPGSWPLGDDGFWETLTVPSVLQHRVATLLVVGLALFEWRVQVGALAATRWRFAFPLLCMAGGAILLSHTHTVIATKSEFLIEVSHGLLGFFAMLVGVGRLLELRLPPGRTRIPGLLWPAALVGTGLVLLFYREL